MALAAAQRGEPERDQRVLMLTQVVAAQRQVLQQVARAGVLVGSPALDPRPPAFRDLDQLLADRGQPLDQFRLRHHPIVAVR